ncbi:TPA: hypothetical protein REU56_002920, partial [Listeria monocytogenes]|nr:hypothetical protein [Listeria monocytogenes]
MEDHAYDSVRYGCMSRPMTSKQPKPTETVIQRHKNRLVSSRVKSRQRIL